MKITLLKKSQRHGLRKMHFSELEVILILCFILSLPFLGLWYGYHWGKPNQQQQLAESAINSMKQQLQDQTEAFVRSKSQAQMKLDALTQKIGLMQAEIHRINALGQRVATLAKVKKGEFDFSVPPGIGGPLEELDSASQFTADDLFHELDDFNAMINDRAYQLDLLESILLNKELTAEVRISGRPIAKGWTSSFYGTRKDPFTGKPAWHGGMDFAGKEGADVIATGAGVVTWSGTRSNYGQMVEINHGSGITTRYAHNSELLVQLGDVVNKGQTIARMGSEGRSTGPHVHYEILRYGKSLNPEKYVNRR